LQLSNHTGKTTVLEISAVFWLLVIIFGIIGLIRGWVQEIQVTAAAVLAMFMVEQITPFIADTLTLRTSAELLAGDPLGTLRRLFLLQCALTGIAVFFGYQGPVVIKFATQNRVNVSRTRDTIQEGLIGLGAGLLNGYVIVGAVWWYLNNARYPFAWATPPLAGSSSEALLRMMPLGFLASPWLEILVVVFFLIVIVVLI